MQQFDPTRHPNLCALDQRVKDLLESDRVKGWDTDRIEYEISKIHPIYFLEQYGYIEPGELEIGDDVPILEGGVIPFKLNPVQLLVADRICAHLLGEKFSRVQIIVLKHRKAGISTLIAGLDYWHMRFFDNIGAFCIADLGSHTDNIVGMVETFAKHDVCGSDAKHKKFRPPEKRPMPKNKSGLRLSNGSMMEQDSGENSNPGTSGTVNVVHMSENSKWRDPMSAEASLLNSVPRRGYAFVVKESTAYGINKYAQDCEDALTGKNAWELIFINWLDMPDCCDEYYPGEENILELTAEEREIMAANPSMQIGHVKFRRRQIETLGSASLFRQDFPLTPREPFLLSGANFFNTVDVQNRIDEIKFYYEWKSNGVENLKDMFPEMLMKIKHHPSGERVALNNLEDRCCVPTPVTFTDNLGAVSYVKDPKARLDEGAGLMFKAPQRRRTYLVIIDVAEGKQSTEYTSDNSVIQVIDSITREQVLEWGGIFDEEITADYAVMIAKIYNNALICPEMNNKCGGALWVYLEKSSYKNLYYRETVKGNSRRREPGWDTKTGIKKDVLSQFRVDFKNRDCTIHSLALLEEMMFFMDLRGKLEAAEGHRDDRVMSYGVGLKVISITPKLNGSSGDSSNVQLPGGYTQDDNPYGRPPPRSPNTRTHNVSAIRRYM
jgi:hypothetical protein